MSYSVTLNVMSHYVVGGEQGVSALFTAKTLHNNIHLTLLVQLNA